MAGIVNTTTSSKISYLGVKRNNIHLCRGVKTILWIYNDSKHTFLASSQRLSTGPFLLK